MDYVRGKQVGLEVNNLDNNGQTKGWRVRSTVLGTIVSSTPRHSKAPNFSYQVNPAAGGGASYAAYVANNANNRRAAVFVGANAGMFHAFDANPNVNQNGGRELFAYVPRSTYPYLSELTNPEYTHRYFVDGPVVEGDVYLNGAWKTVVMGSSGAGPAGLFALDVTAPEAFDSTKVLWDITPAEEPDLGKVMGNGYIGSVKWGANGGKWVALVPNGYQSTNNHAVLLVIDIQTGQTLRKIDTCNLNNGTPFGGAAQGGRCNANALNGLANVTPIFDAHRNIVGAFAGDYQGNLWKFDLSNGTAANWRIETEDPNDGTGNTPIPLFTAVDAQNKPQPITAAPRASTHPYGGSYVIIGTGKFFEYPDQTSTDMQSMYGLWVRPGDKAPILMSRSAEVRLERDGSEQPDGAHADRHRRIQLAVQARLVGRPRGQQSERRRRAGRRRPVRRARGADSGVVPADLDQRSVRRWRDVVPLRDPDGWRDRTHHRGEDQRRDRRDHGRRNPTAADAALELAELGRGAAGAAEPALHAPWRRHVFGQRA